MNCQCAWCNEGLESAEVTSVAKVMFATGHVEHMQPPPFHAECFIRAFIGPVGHFLKQCPCFGGKLVDPPGLSKREAARAAFRLWLEQTRFGRMPQHGHAEHCEQVAFAE